MLKLEYFIDTWYNVFTTCFLPKVNSKYYSIPIEDIKSKKRNENIAGARHAAIYLVRKMTELSLKDIGNIFGRNHATVLSSIDKVDINIKTKNGYEDEIKTISKRVKGKTIEVLEYEVLTDGDNNPYVMVNKFNIK